MDNLNNFVVVVYEGSSIKRSILVVGDTSYEVSRRTAERVFKETIVEETGLHHLSDETLTDATNEGRIEVNGGMTEIYLCCPSVTVFAK